MVELALDVAQMAKILFNQEIPQRQLGPPMAGKREIHLLIVMDHLCIMDKVG